MKENTSTIRNFCYPSRVPFWRPKVNYVERNIRSSYPCRPWRFVQWHIGYWIGNAWHGNKQQHFDIGNMDSPWAFFGRYSHDGNIGMESSIFKSNNRCKNQRYAKTLEMVGTKTRTKVKSILFLSAISIVFIIVGIAFLKELSEYVV
jgi:hypothetical protein